MILKAGTYTFNDVLTELVFEQDINLTVLLVEDDTSIVGSVSKIKCVKDTWFSMWWYFNSYLIDGEEVLDEPQYLPIYSTNPDIDNNSMPFTLNTDQDVDDTVGEWIILNTNYNEVNTKPLAEITYNGETIAQLNAGDKATIPCSQYTMSKDLVFKVNEVESKIPEGYIKPEGSLSITENGTYPVTDKEEVVVDVPIPEGYIKPEGSLTITENGTHPVTDKEEVIVDVPIPDKTVVTEPIQISTEAEMNAILENATADSIETIYRYVGESTNTYENNGLYIVGWSK